MKKTFYVLACIMAVAALTLSGCKKDNDGDNNGGNGGNGGGGTTIVNGDIEVDGNGNAVHNGSGTVTIDGVEYAINVARLQDYAFDEERNSVVNLYTEYAPNANSYQGVRVSLQFNNTNAASGDYISDEGGDVYLAVELASPFKGYVFTNEIHFTRNSNNSITLEASQENVPGSNADGNNIQANSISVSYSGPCYYRQWSY